MSPRRNAARAATDPLAPFSEATRTWFADAFEGPTRAQELGWAAISGGKHALIHAPTGSGKTLAAFLWCLDRLMTEPAPAKPTVRVLYVSPLKALTYDVERNLRAPLAGIRRTAEREGTQLPEIAVASRTGDTPANERRKLVTRPPDVLITTPEYTEGPARPTLRWKRSSSYGQGINTSRTSLWESKAAPTTPLFPAVP